MNSVNVYTEEQQALIDMFSDDVYLYDKGHTLSVILGSDKMVNATDIGTSMKIVGLTVTKSDFRENCLSMQHKIEYVNQHLANKEIIFHDKLKYEKFKMNIVAYNLLFRERRVALKGTYTNERNPAISCRAKYEELPTPPQSETRALVPNASFANQSAPIIQNHQPKSPESALNLTEALPTSTVAPSDALSLSPNLPPALHQETSSVAVPVDASPQQEISKPKTEQNAEAPLSMPDPDSRPRSLTPPSVSEPPLQSQNALHSRRPFAPEEHKNKVRSKSSTTDIFVLERRQGERNKEHHGKAGGVHRMDSLAVVKIPKELQAGPTASGTSNNSDASQPAIAQPPAVSKRSDQNKTERENQKHFDTKRIPRNAKQTPDPLARPSSLVKAFNLQEEAPQ